MADNDLNEVIEEFVEDATVITVNIDDTLTVSGDAADAKAVGDALALKADRSELSTAVTVNGQGADAQGAIIVTANETKMSSSDNTTVKAKIEAVDGKTAADIYMSSDPAAKTVAEEISESVSRTADLIAMSASDPTTVKSAVEAVAGDLSTLSGTVTAIGNKTAADIRYVSGSAETIKQHVDAIDQGLVKTVYGVGADANGDVSPASVPYAENLASDQMEQVNDTFVERTTGGELGISGQNAWILRLEGNRVHTGYTAETLNMTVNAVPRPTPAAITAALDKATFIAFVEVAGTYTLEYDEGSWSEAPATYGVTVTNDPVDGDEITIVWDGENDPVMTVSAVPRTAPPEITATIDRDTFVAYVSMSGTTTLTYSTAWSADPALYGVTITNIPVAGDYITIVYVKEVRGTITVATPSALVATGWNLYDHANGYARVVKYSNSYGYRIDGTYTSLEFTTDPEEEGTTITPDANGVFSVSADGYVVVTGGNGTDTCIYPVWSDWGSGHAGSWQAYTESTIDLSGLIGGATFFPNGLCRVGDGNSIVRDEIDFNQKIAYNRIQRMAYNSTNLASAQASGRAYEYDEDYIYLVRETATTTAISMEAEYACNDHGLEWFEDTTVGPYAEILYGQNLKDKLKNDVITYRMTVSEVKGMGS